MGAFDNITIDSVQVHVAGEPWRRWAAPRTVDAQPGFRLKLDPSRDLHRDSAQGPYSERVFADEKSGLRAIAHRQDCLGSPLARHWVTIANEGTTPFALDVLHAAFIGNIGWDDPEALRLHVPSNQNLAEAQWREGTLMDYGLVKNAKPNVGQVIVNALGRSAQTHVPMAMLEDTRSGQTLIWQIEHAGSWMWDLGQGSKGELNLALGGLTETYGHWRRVLQPGQTVSTFPVSVGVVDGDAQAALDAMVHYRRRACRQPHPVDDACPVIFNDFMNCLNGNPTSETSLPLIARAAAADCEIYCIDAGWFGLDCWDLSIGDWHENPNRFQGGLNALIQTIEKAGMVPGLWIEIEAVSTWATAAKLPDAWFLSLHGHRTEFSDRNLLDFRNPEVLAFADEALDRIIRDYRLGYIKFDYNCSPLIGTDVNADSPGAGLLDHINAVLAWYRRLAARHPRVIFENCASGGMRNEYAMLSILQLASISDQSDYRLMPAIVSGSLATVLPEQLGVWSCALKAGGREEAVFNMINAMLARIHLSGELAALDDDAFEAVREGVAFYRQRLRADIPTAIPVWPLGRIGMEQTKTFQCVGLHVPHHHRLWLAVWRLNGDEQTASIPLERWLGNSIRVEQVYPQTPVSATSTEAGTLSVTLPERYTARLFCVNTR